MNKYPVYIVSKGRHETPLTATFLAKDNVPFKIVVEPQEAENYSRAVGRENVLVLPFSNLGLGSIPARNWIWQHSKSLGAERHWILDDNIRGVRKYNYGKREPCNSHEAFTAVEKFVSKYENIGLAALTYTFMVIANGSKPKMGWPPFFLNVHCYSFILILNSLPFQWRGRYNEDTDLTLQVLSTKRLCTVLVNAFMCDKVATMTMKGGNTDKLYEGNGRLKMARSLEQAWSHTPGLVKTIKNFGRAQHWVNWRQFKQPLIKKK